MMASVTELSRTVGVSAACQALQVPRCQYYRARDPFRPGPVPSAVRPSPPRALTEDEREQVRTLLDSDRFQDLAPREVYATDLDDGHYLCSWRTMYRILADCHEIHERRNQAQHPAYVKPQLVATGPNQLWSWDITKLLGPAKWLFYYLYVILDVFSRYVVGWMLAECESAELADQLITSACAKEGIVPGQLTPHADRGAVMTSQSLAQLVAKLGVIQSHSRPHVSDDNPYSEAQFKTMKYRPDYPARFGSAPDARRWAHDFFTWYNQEHYHSALGLLTPAIVHSGQASNVLSQRQAVLQAAYTAHPERFVNGPPTAEPPPPAVWINRPQPLLEIPPSIAP
jgi:putative transposase